MIKVASSSVIRVIHKVRITHVFIVIGIFSHMGLIDTERNHYDFLSLLLKYERHVNWYQCWIFKTTCEGLIILPLWHYYSNISKTVSICKSTHTYPPHLSPPLSSPLLPRAETVMAVDMRPLPKEPESEKKKHKGHKAGKRHKEADKPNISYPTNFEHTIHVGFDACTGEFTVSSSGWQGFVCCISIFVIFFSTSVSLQQVSLMLITFQVCRH